MLEVLREVSRMGRTRARVVVINFEEMQTEEIYLKLSYLSEKKDLNNCTVIAFKVRVGKKSILTKKFQKDLIVWLKLLVQDIYF